MCYICVTLIIIIMKHTSFRIDTETDRKVTQLAERNNITRSQQYREIIRQFFNQNWYKKLFK